MYDEILKHKSELDKVRDKGDAIVQRSSDPRVSNNMMQLYTKYQALCTSSKVGRLTSQIFVCVCGGGGGACVCACHSVCHYVCVCWGGGGFRTPLKRWKEQQLLVIYTEVSLLTH